MTRVRSSCVKILLFSFDHSPFLILQHQYFLCKQFFMQYFYYIINLLIFNFIFVNFVLMLLLFCSYNEKCITHRKVFSFIVAKQLPLSMNLHKQIFQSKLKGALNQGFQKNQFIKSLGGKRKGYEFNAHSLFLFLVNKKY